MATPDASRIAVGASLVTGAIFVAPTTTPLPDDGTSELSGYECLGFTSDDGIVISESSSNNSLRVWEGRTEVRNTRTEYTETISFTPVECNAEVAKLLWGSGHVTVDGETGSLKIEHHGQTMDPIHIVIETVPFEGAVARYCSKAQLTERGDMTGNGQDYSGRQATMNCLAVDGVTMTEYVVFTAETEAQAQAEPEPDATLSALTIGSLELTPAFAADTTAYTATTSNATNTITATPADEGAAVDIAVGGAEVQNGQAATWATGENTVTVTVTNGTATKVYTVTVTKGTE